MKKFSALSALLLGILFSVSIVNGQARRQPSFVKCKTTLKNAPPYSLGTKSRTLDGPPTLLLQIGVKPKHFNREDMMLLGQRLGLELCQEERVHIGIFDDRSAAKDYGTIYAYLAQKTEPGPLRGFYDLDRVAKKATLQFCTKRNNPLDEVVIDLTLSAKQGKAQGIVIDPNGSRIAGAVVRLKLVGDETSTYESLSDKLGRYEFEVKPGIYLVTTSVEGYNPIRRSLFRVESKQQVSINLRPALRLLSIGLKVTSQGTEYEVEKAAKVKYKSFAIPKAISPLNCLFLQFYQNKKQGKWVSFSKATATFDCITIIAEEIRVNSATLSIQALGEVTFESEGQEIKEDCLELEFENGLWNQRKCMPPNKSGE